MPTHTNLTDHDAVHVLSRLVGTQAACVAFSTVASSIHSQHAGHETPCNPIVAT